jgi:hypothetical protein
MTRTSKVDAGFFSGFMYRVLKMRRRGEQAGFHRPRSRASK